MAKIAFICGGDDYLLEESAHEFIKQCRQAQSDLDLITIDGAVNNSTEASVAVGQVLDALAEQDLFGSSHLIWLKNASFLTGGTASKSVLESEATKKAVTRLAETLKSTNLPPDDVLLITAPRCLKSSVFWKTCEAVGEVKTFEMGTKPREREKAILALLPDLCQREGIDLPKTLFATLIQKVGTDVRTLVNELQKLHLYCGEKRPTANDIEEICATYSQAEFWDVKNAIGDRSISALLHTLQLLSGQKNIGIPIANSVFNLLEEMILVQECLAKGWLRGGNWSESIPEEVRMALVASGLQAKNSWALRRLVEQVGNYSAAELQWGRHYAMEMRQALVSTGGGDEAFIVQTGLLKIIGKTN